MGFLTRLWNWLRQFVGLLLPFFSKARDFRGIGQKVRWILHGILLVGVVVGLWFVNYIFDLEKVLRAPWPLVRKGWLPILFLLVYVLSWLGWWLWKLLGPEEESSAFPDIDDAWEEAVQNLNQAGLDLTELPLFLILGQPASSEDALFQATQLQLAVKGAPQRSTSPLHVYANRDGIYVTCAGASLLGRQASIFAGKETIGQASGGAGYNIPAAETGMDDDPFKTLQPKGRVQREIQDILATAHRQGRDLTDEEKQKIRRLDSEEKGQLSTGGKQSASLLKNPMELELYDARLKHLSRLIVRDRRPFCSLNGILVLVPFAAGDSDDNASLVAALCQQDLNSAREILKVHCPVFSLLCDMETTLGFPEFIDRLSETERQRRVGQRLPLVPDIDPGEMPAMVEGGVKWICQSLVPTWVYRLLRLETPGAKDQAVVVQGNYRLYQLMCQMSERQKRFSRVLSKGILAVSGGPPLLGGFYLAGTGRDSSAEQAFVAGVFRRLVENQNFVSWTEDALREEDSYQRYTRLGYIGIGVFTVGLVSLGYFFWSKG